MKTLLTTLLLIAATAFADDHNDKRRCRRHRHENRNYIIERQETYQVEGVPTSRIIVGRREIDIYPSGQRFEKDHMVGDDD